MKKFIFLIPFIAITNLFAITINNPNVILPGSVGTTAISDGAVTEPKLSFDPATQTELDIKSNEIAIDTASLKNKTDGLTIDTSTLGSQFSSLSIGTSTLEGKVGNLSIDTTTLGGSVSSLSSNVNYLSIDTTTLGGQTTTLLIATATLASNFNLDTVHNSSSLQSAQLNITSGTFQNDIYTYTDFVNQLAGGGVLVKAPDLTCFRIKIINGGQMQSVSAVCK